ncbi:hypothetical protein LXL04_030789 [Taraxacum kok-saghyz]
MGKVTDEQIHEERRKRKSQRKEEKRKGPDLQKIAIDKHHNNVYQKIKKLKLPNISTIGITPKYNLFRKNLMNKTDNLTVVQQQCKFALLEEQGEESLDKMQFTGPFPAAILEIPNLLYLDLRFNSFSGQIPQDFFSKNLDAIFLNNNQFDGKIPQTLGNSPASVINLANNKLTGDIPVNFGYTSPKLKEILFMNTKIKNIPFAALSVKLAKEKGGYCCKRGGKSDDVWLIYRFSVKMMRGPNSMGSIDLSSDGDAVKWCNDLYGGREDKAAVGWWRGWKRVEESDIGVGGQIREIFGEISGFTANDPVIRKCVEVSFSDLCDCSRDLYNNLNSCDASKRNLYGPRNVKMRRRKIMRIRELISVIQFARFMVNINLGERGDSNCCNGWVIKDGVGYLSNPVHKKVLVLVHSGNPITESLVIVEYINDVWKGVPILPQDPYEKAIARFWAKFIDDKIPLDTHTVIIDEYVVGYLVSFEDLYEEILQARLKLDEKINETNEKFPINLEISEWMPRFDGFFWDFIVDG